ncbi:MAG TPA: glycosyltransferase, partial [Mucilaginibacter sp.]
FFIEPNEPLSEQDYYKKVIEAIKPTIDFYTELNSADSGEWEYWLINQLFEKWTGWMDKLFAKFAIVKLPATVPVSVIVCTRNRASYLRQCLEMLYSLRCRPEEIIVVDNAPSDNSSKSVVSEFKDVKYIREPKGGLSVARNTGILNAKCPLIAFTDDDATVHPLWPYRLWETFENPSVDAMVGLVLSSQLETEAQFIFEKYWSFNRGFTDKTFDKDYLNTTFKQGTPVWEIGAGVNMAFRKSIFDNVGLFDERLGAGASGCSEDSEIWYRILTGGGAIRYNPRAIIYHEHRKDIQGLKKQIFYYMKGHTAAALLQQLQHPGAGYRKRIFVGLPKYYWSVLVKEFPFYRFQFRTVGVEIKGMFSGLIFYHKNKKLTSKNSKN